MKILLNVLTALLLTSQVAYAQSYIGGRKVTEAEVLTFRGIPSTKVSRSNQAVIYQSSVDGKLKCSEDGGAFTDCVGGSSASGDKITEGNTEAEVVDTGSDGHFKVTTEGTERLRVTETGNVGIGTTNPTAKLQISGNLYVGTVGASYGISGYLGAKNDWYALYPNAYVVPGVGWYYLNNGPAGGIGFVNGDWLIGSAPNNSNGAGAQLIWPTSTMVLKGSGNVGIGTTAPISRLHAVSTTEQLRLGYDTSNYFSTTVGSTGAVTLDAVGSGQEFIFNDNLDVKSDSGVQLATSGLNIGGAIRTHNETGSSNGIVIDANRLSGKISFVTHLTEKMRLTNGGNLGIGTTAPSAKLHTISTTEQLRLGYDKSNYVSTTVGSTGIVTHDAVGSGSSFVFSDPVIVTPTAAQTIAAGNTITANACGSIKEITAAGAVTTDTTNTFTAPAAANDGCCMDVVNIGAENITLDNNANFVSAGAADVVLGAGDTLRVCSTGASGKWYQIGSTGNNCGDEAGGDRVEKITTYVGNAQLDTAQSKFGGSSLLLDGNSDYVTISDSDDWNFGTGNFTWEAWVYFNSFNATYNTIINQGESDGLPEIHFFYHQDSPGPGLFFWVYDNSSELFRIYTSGALSTSTWYHLAVVRSGTGTGDTNLYINGIKQSVSTSGAWNYNIVDVSEPLTIGRRTTYYTSGYFDEIRISKGIARWTADFTPPTAEYLPDQYTKLLLHFGGSDNSSATATEDSSEGENK